MREYHPPADGPEQESRGRCVDVGQDRPRTGLNGGHSLVESFLIFGDWDTLLNTRVSRGMPEAIILYSQVCRVYLLVPQHCDTIY